MELAIDTHIGAAVGRRLVDESVHVPAHCDLEVGSGLRRAVLHHELSARDGVLAFDAYRSAAMSRWEIRPLLGRAWELLHAVTFADALYVALAEVLKAPLLTCDEHLARSAGHHAVIETP